MLFSIEVRFFRRFPRRSWELKLGVVVAVEEPSASANHFCNNGFSLHMLLKLRLRAFCRALNLRAKINIKFFKGRSALAEGARGTANF